MIPSSVGNVVYNDDGRDVNGAGIDRTPLPLNLLSQIMSHVSDPADLARACRTCRMFYYMCLPNLYNHVKLKSYDHVRISPETARPEGCGMGSPFVMGLNALAIRPVAQYVKNFEVIGQYKEPGAEDYASVGRVADGGMMINILVRAAIERMPMLHTFTWSLNVKMLSVVWDALVQKQTVKTLKIRFPTDRIPSPIYTVPPIRHLKSLTIYDIDPLCFPDNLQTLLYESLAIEHLRMHWSPRMRRERETSTNLHMYFGKIWSSSKKMRLKSIAMQNLYCLGQQGNFLGLYDPAYLESMTAIDATGGADDDANISFVIEPPKRLAPMPRLRMLRGNKVSRPHCDGLKKMAPLQRYYLISGRELREDRTPSNSRTGSVASPGSQISDGYRGSMLYDGTRSIGGTPQSHNNDHKTSSPSFSGSNPFASASTPGSGSDVPIINLGRDYMDNIFKYHGATLTHLLLLPQWRLSSKDIRQLTISCKEMIQLGIGVEDSSFDTLQAIIPNMRKLKVLRILDPPPNWAGSEGMDDNFSPQAQDEWFEEKISDQTWQAGWDVLKWLGLGNQVFELLGRGRAEGHHRRRRRRRNDKNNGANDGGYDSDMDTAEEEEEDNEEGDDGDEEMTRRVIKRPLTAIMDIDIWKMDQKTIVF